MHYIEKEIQVRYPAGTKKDGYQPVLCCYLQNRAEELPGSEKRPAVIVCPGGAYRFKSDREGEPVAFRFLAAGMQAAPLAVAQVVVPHRAGIRPERPAPGLPAAQ